MRAEAARQAELRALVARLEQSGLAERREDVARLLARSRALLAAQGAAAGARPAPAPSRMTRRRRPRRVGLRARLRAGLLLLLDAAALAALGFAAVGLSAGTLAVTAGLAVLGAAALWGVLRWGGAPEMLAEGAARLAYLLRWAGLWLAEPFHDGAWERLEALLDAREVMRAWRRHRRGLPVAGLAEVEGFLAEHYGRSAAARFRAAVEARRSAGWTLRGGEDAPEALPLSEARLMRWSVLIRLFEAVAAGGALWVPEPPAPEPAAAEEAPPRPHLDPLPPPTLRDPEAEYRAARREELRELIRRKRQDITTAHNWKLKTRAEIAQRDAYLQRLRSEIAALEKEIAALGR
ncbi:hypothetical protein [Rubritepida flocculans]|uniref:hypothetical protein n=1 Tax=Rubritepida flocculans TaxID=182403 RepID=UPI00042257FB|nr:hypothetical protein [Rubritepida flocculans]